ncbi:uncharacterized protein L201_001562 [Kwoniella dendrophila CBS 6074]|uniref:Uncharacterized protein n=1 Tax=Kwoniella dendrophila CBS 6074 TaxID=1295534 RepID=A0AAX4JQ57_9TREE
MNKANSMRLSGTTEDQNMVNIFNVLSRDEEKYSPLPTEGFEKGWRQPKFIPTQAYDRALAKERMLIPRLGGRSKRAQLGSIEESWGNDKPKSQHKQQDRSISWANIDGKEEKQEQEQFEERKGMFELDEDPPSRNVSPFREEELEEEEDDAQEPFSGEGIQRWEEREFERKKQEFLIQARRGTKYDGGRNSEDEYGKKGNRRTAYHQDIPDTVSRRTRNHLHAFDYDHQRTQDFSSYYDEASEIQNMESISQIYCKNEKDCSKDIEDSYNSKAKDPVIRDFAARSAIRETDVHAGRQFANEGEEVRHIKEKSQASGNSKLEQPPDHLYTQADDYKIWLKRLERGKVKRR